MYIDRPEGSLTTTVLSQGAVIQEMKFHRRSGRAMFFFSTRADCVSSSPSSSPKLSSFTFLFAIRPETLLSTHDQERAGY